MDAAFTGKRILIWGAARSGLAAVTLLAPHAAEVCLADDRPLDEFASRLPDSLRGLPFAGGGEVPRDLESFDFLVVSPGVPLSHPVLASAGRRGLPVLSELEVGARFSAARLVAITGTNGKTTVATLAAHLLGGEEAGVFLAGNVGRAICEVVQRPEARAASATLIVEVSSFQCEHLDEFHPAVAVVLNLRPDHLDRHGDMATYRACKAAMGRRLTDDDTVIHGAEEPAVAEVIGDWRGRRLPFGAERGAGRGIWLEGDEVIFDDGDARETLLRRGDIPMPGRHSLLNALAAAGIARCCGARPGDIAARCRTFAGVPHRIEPVATIGGVAFINDSKATNLDSLKTALSSFERVVLIAGGRSKGEDPASIAETVRAHARALVLIGEEAEAMERAWGAETPTERADDLRDAVTRAQRLARPGDVVLLSPGCPSFDMFRDFEDRGDQFRECVRALASPSEVRP